MNIYTYHIVYKTTNLSNNKFYVGVHATNDLNDSYLGSGSQLLEAVKNFRKENFSREILHIFSTSEEAYAKEKQIVDKEFVSNEKTYNLTLGGYGLQPGSVRSEETRKRMSKAKTGVKFSEEHRQKLSVASSKRRVTDKTKKLLSEIKKGISLSEEHKLKLSIAAKKRPKRKLSEEHKLKISLARQKFEISKDT